MNPDFSINLNEAPSQSAEAPINDELNMLKNSLGHRDPNLSPISIAIGKCRHYKNNFFKIGDISNLSEDIALNGLIHPIVVRRIGNDEYEIISGHRRYEASKAAGKTTIEAYIIELDDAKADLFMVNANLQQRQNLSKVELAKGYRIRQANESHQGKKEGEQMYKKFGREMGRSDSYAKRILYLSAITDSLLDLIDEKLLPATSAERLRFLSKDQMNELSDLIKKDQHVLTLGEAVTLIESAKSRPISEVWSSIFNQAVPVSTRKTINVPIDRSYIPEGVSDAEFRQKIAKILEQKLSK